MRFVCVCVCVCVCVLQGDTPHWKDATLSFALSLLPLAVLNDVAVCSLAVGEMEKWSCELQGCNWDFLTALSATAASFAQGNKQIYPLFFFNRIHSSKQR